MGTRRFGPTRRSEARSEPEIATLAANAVSLHRQAVELVGVLALGYGFDAQFFWQPTIFDKPRGEDLAAHDIRAGRESAYHLATAQIAAPLIDISDSLAGLEAQVFTDQIHTNEAGAEAVAQAIYRLCRYKTPSGSLASVFVM